MMNAEPRNSPYEPYSASSSGRPMKPQLVNTTQKRLSAKLACEPLLRKMAWLTTMLRLIAVHVHRAEMMRALPSAGSKSR